MQKFQNKFQEIMQQARTAQGMEFSFEELNTTLDTLMLGYAFNTNEEILQPASNLFVEYYFLKRVLIAAEKGQAPTDFSVTLNPSLYLGLKK